MELEPLHTLGFVAGLLTTFAFVPQLHRIWKTRSARDVSLPAFAIFTVGVGIWLLYGILRHEPAITFWNAVTLVIAGAILWMKIRFG